MATEPDPDLEDINDLIRQMNALARSQGTPADGLDELPAEDDGAGPADRPVDRLVERMPERSQLGSDPGPGGGSVRAIAWGSLPGDESTERLQTLLRQAREAGASDLFLVAGAAPTVRVHGQLRPLVPSPLDSAEAGRLCAALVPEARRGNLTAAGTVDLSWGSAREGRFRCNVHRESGGWAAAIRLLPPTVPSLEELNLPADLAVASEFRHGLVLVTGPASSGKSTTIAALLAQVTARRRAHVIAIEDPCEFRHPPGQSLVEQIEVGRDTPSYAAALRSALRQAPDVLLVGEMRDPETIALAVTAAETGHLVFSTLHTGDASQSVTRILDAYPAAQMAFVRSQLAAGLMAVISQQLVPRADGHGRVPAVEVLIATDAVRNLIQKGHVEQISAQVTVGREKGMRSLDASLADLVRNGLVDRAEARARARRPREFELLLG